jgi:hypothetical protein
LPFGPGRPEEAKPSTAAPSPRAHAATATSSARRWSGSRITPPLPTLPRPASNCGLIIARTSCSGAAQASTAGSTFVSEMNDTSTTTRSGAYGSAAGSIARAFVRSRTVTRSSLRSPQSSSP